MRSAYAMATPVGEDPPSVATEQVTVLRQMIMGFRTTQLLHVAAKLGLADQLAQGPRNPYELAQSVGANPGALHRLLRALASLGVFAEAEDGTFELTPLARLLQRDVPGSLNDLARLYGESWTWQAYGAMAHSVETGRCAFEHVHGAPLFEYLGQHSGAGALFHSAMSGYSNIETAAILGAYDFSGIGSVVDIGGGEGALLAAVLNKCPELIGSVLDRDTVADAAERLFAMAGLGRRARFVAGDFFADVPGGGDLYLMKSVIHNWDDDDAVAILRNCRRAMRQRARLLVIERVLPPGNAGAEAKLFDINMLVMVGGKERTACEHRCLLDAADLDLTRIIPTSSPMSVIEAMPK